MSQHAHHDTSKPNATTGSGHCPQMWLRVEVLGCLCNSSVDSSLSTKSAFGLVLDIRHSAHNQPWILCWLSSARAQCACHALMTLPLAAMTAFCLFIGAQHWSLPSLVLGAHTRSDYIALIPLLHAQPCNSIYIPCFRPWQVESMTVTACPPVKIVLLVLDPAALYLSLK